MSIFTELFLSAILVGVSPHAGPSAHEVDARMRDAVEAPPPLATWKDLCDRPGRWLGKTVRLQVQYHSRVETWNPYITRFGPRQFGGIQAWADDQFPWIQAEYDAPAVRVFLRRGEACDWAVESAKPGARFEMTGIVRETFLDLPWVEILEVLPLAERISEGTVIHVGKAQELMKAKSFARAQMELDQAITDDLPALARAELERLRGLCREDVDAEKGPKSPPPAKR
jgi:hypothetical protein